MSRTVNGPKLTVTIYDKADYERARKEGPDWLTSEWDAAEERERKGTNRHVLIEIWRASDGNTAFKWRFSEAYLNMLKNITRGLGARELI